MIKTCLDEETFELNENFLCIDFLNTLDWRERDEPRESLKNYTDLLDWAERKRLLTSAEAKVLLKKSKSKPHEAEKALGEAQNFRALRDHISATTSAAKRSTAKAIKSFNVVLRDALGHLELELSDGQFSLEILCKTDLLSPILWPIAISAAQLLSSEELSRIGICQDDDGCGYFFYDTSKNQSKKYCGSNCASRAKVRRFRSKQS